MTTPSPQMITGLYRSTLRTAKAFNSYNFRNYFVRRTNDVFRTMQSEADAQKLKTMYREATADLLVLRRSAIVNQIYGGARVAVETGEHEVLERSES